MPHLYTALCSTFGPTSYWCRAFAPELASDWLAAVLSIAGVGIALFAAKISLDAVRASYRPVMLPSLRYSSSAPEQPADCSIDNIGSGPALVTVLYEASGSYFWFRERKWIGGCGLIEGRASGNVTFKEVQDDAQPGARHRITSGKRYEILCLDLEGQWHVIDFERIGTKGAIVKRLGTVGRLHRRFHPVRKLDQFGQPSARS
ncbi:MAG: hypothetical protein Q8T13_16395 [Acidobacteriota bacterium]|nr:hypothetical protein [Acidobacteriota bacterium]